MNMLKAVFWDYPRLAEPDILQNYIRLNRANRRVYLWVLRRFLECGRAVDALRFFPLRDISKLLPEIRLSAYSRKKWNRIISVYEHDRGE